MTDSHVEPELSSEREKPRQTSSAGNEAMKTETQNEEEMIMVEIIHLNEETPLEERPLEETSLEKTSLEKTSLEDSP